MSQKRALVVIAQGSEELESVTPTIILRRGGIEVVVAGLYNSDPVKGSRDFILGPQLSLEQAVKNNGDFDAVILPGGFKSEILLESELLGQILKNHAKSDKILAGICASPLAFKKHGIYEGRRITSHPLVKDQMIAGNGARYLYQDNERVVIDGSLITSQGPDSRSRLDKNPWYFEKCFRKRSKVLSAFAICTTLLVTFQGSRVPTVISTALEWSLKILEKLMGKEISGEVAESILVHPSLLEN